MKGTPRASPASRLACPKNGNYCCCRPRRQARLALRMAPRAPADLSKASFQPAVSRIRTASSAIRVREPTGGPRPRARG